MFCRTCGSQVNDNAEVCVKCGCKPLIGNGYCQNCGTKTTAQQVMCTKCGVRLKSAMTTAQKKKTVEKQGLKILGNVLFVICILLFVGLAANFITVFMARNQWQAAQHLSGAIKCGIFGAIFFIAGTICKKKSKG